MLGWVLESSTKLSISLKQVQYLSLFSRSPCSFAVIIVSSTPDIRTRMIGWPVGFWIQIHLNPRSGFEELLAPPLAILAVVAKARNYLLAYFEF